MMFFFRSKVSKIMFDSGKNDWFIIRFICTERIQKPYPITLIKFILTDE